MPSEQRLHLSSLLFDVARHVKQFALPAVLVAFGASRSTGGEQGTFARLPSGWEVWLLLLFVPATIMSVIRYLTFRFSYDDRELVIRTGLVFRNVRKIPFPRIQNVDAIQNVLHRMLGVAEVRIETGGGKEEEARLSVLPYAAFIEMRDHIFRERISQPAHPVHPEHPEHPAHPVLVHLNLRELLLCGFLENKGMVLIGAAFGVGWESGVLGRFTDQFFYRTYFRSLIESFTEGGPFPIARVGIALAAIAVFLVAVRIISMLWALVRLYDFRLTRVGEDLRSEYGLFTKVAATVPIRRVQTITIAAGPLHRLLKRTTVRVATAGGGGGAGAKERSREWLAPLITEQALPHLLTHVLPGFELSSVEWQRVHPRAFARAIKPALLFTVLVALSAAIFIGRGAIGIFIVMLLWNIFTTRKHVQHLGWAAGEEVVLMKSGWMRRQITLARVNRIQAVALRQTPFDRRAAMARVRVDTAGASEFSHRLDIPYLDHDIARALARQLSAAAASTTFRW
ncbi:MAG TPA: PH domain-containing protein [Vicinamibacterales bacterium]